MKKSFSFILALVLIGSMGFAQSIFSVSGVVSNPNGTAANGVVVLIKGQQGFNYSDSTTTNPNGFYSFGINNTILQRVFVEVCIVDCNGNIQRKSLALTAGVPGVANFTYCSNTLPCKASYTKTVNGGLVNFTNTSVGIASSTGISWNFGDGHFSNLASPIHSYTRPGTYNACLNIFDSITNCFDQYCRTLQIGTGSGPCNAKFTYSATAGGGIGFNNLSSGNPMTTTYSWSFGDGTSSSAFNPVHNYNPQHFPAYYVVCLTITERALGGICTDTYCDSIVVNGNNSGCRAAFSFNASGSVYSFTDQSTGTGNFNYHWSFGDNHSSTQASPMHTYSRPGSYTVCLSISDSLNNCFDRQCKVIRVQGSNSCIDPGLIDTTIMCPAIFQPVCGCDSVTYSNSCVAENYYGVTRYTQGACNFVPPPTSCKAKFTYSGAAGGGLTFQFTDRSTGTGNFNYSWDFGDNTGSTLANPSHSYMTSGSYTVCLTIFDSLRNCHDVSCQRITVGTPPPCKALFTWVAQGSSVSFSNRSTPAGALYRWSFGDGTGSSQANPFHTFASNGHYFVCLTVTDSINNCFSTFCDSVVIGGGSGNCKAKFVGVINGNSVTFNNSSTGGTPANTSFQWSFGDGTSSNLAMPTHVYSPPHVPWAYKVCLTMTVRSALGTVCTSIYCDSIVIGNSTGKHSLSGQVFKGNGPLAQSAIVYLIEHDTAARTLTAVDSQHVRQGSYFFPQIRPGRYLVKAGLLRSDMDYRNFLPTYHGNSTFWNFAAPVFVFSNVQRKNVNLIAGHNPGGSVFISGKISQGAGFAPGPGDPVPNASILLYTFTDQPVTHTTSDSNGLYMIDKLPYGTYKVYVEIAGKTGPPHIVTLNAANPSISGRDFTVHSSWIALSSNEPLHNISFKSYPNPVSDKHVIEFESDVNDGVNIVLRDILAKQVYQQTVKSNAGIHRVEIDFGYLQHGVYMLEVNGKELNVHRRIIKN